MHPLEEYLIEQKKKPLIEKVRDLFYVSSPFDLGSKNDDLYRDAIDEVLGDLEECKILTNSKREL